MMPRREFSSRIRLRAFERAEGRCENCGVKLTPGNVEYDHALPDGLGGEPTLANCKVLCRNCHGAKTHGEDRPRMIKADRSKKKAYGMHRPRQRLGSQKWKRKVDGTVVRRDG